ncbi:serine/threonine-protein kinase [Actinomadura viridis]|uniref:serine/threonine-protein kinase n=1 Tax=Actinomadura viridis TaxID=58110 RepID=UPI00369BB960
MTRVLAGRYRLVRRLGAGGMGVVWSGRDDVLGRDVAVKELLLPDHLGPEQREQAARRALREARASALLRHPSIVTVHDVVMDEGRPCIVMDLLPGRSLDAVVADDGPLAPERAARVGIEVLGALRVAHAQGVLHRDVKPANIFLRDDGRAILTDFGIASLEGDATLTQEGSLLGSPAYMAPERVQHAPSGPPSDLWSLGATLYTLVEGRSPFARATLMGTLGAVLADEPAPPRDAGPLGPLLMAMLAKDPASRPSAEATESSLRALAAGRQPLPSFPPPSDPLPSAPLPSAPLPSPPSSAAAHATGPQGSHGRDGGGPGQPTVPSAHPGRTGKSGVAWVIGAVTVACAAVAAAVIAIVALDGPSGPSSGRTAPAAAPSRSAPAASGTAPARLTAPPSPCGLVTAEQAARLVPGFFTTNDSGTEASTGMPRKSCTWMTSPGRADRDAQLTVTLRTAPDRAAAGRRLAKERDAGLSGVAPVADLGDEAYSAESGARFLVLFRVGDLLAEVAYRAERPDASQEAVKVARRVGKSLARSR